MKLAKIYLFSFLTIIVIGTLTACPNPSQKGEEMTEEVMEEVETPVEVEAIENNEMESDTTSTEEIEE